MKQENKTSYIFTGDNNVIVSVETAKDFVEVGFARFSRDSAELAELKKLIASL